MPTWGRQGGIPWTEGPGIPPWSAPDGETPDTHRHSSLTECARFSTGGARSHEKEGKCDAVKSQASGGTASVIRPRRPGGGRPAGLNAASAVVLGSGVGVAHADVNPALGYDPV